MTPQEQPDSQDTRCVVCNAYCDESGLCDKHKYDSQAGDELEAMFERFNGSGAHACYCPRSVDGGCTCAIKDEYVVEAKAQIRDYAERLATERAIAELKAADGHCGFAKGNSVYLNERIAELSASLPPNKEKEKI